MVGKDKEQVMEKIELLLLFRKEGLPPIPSLQAKE